VRRVARWLLGSGLVTASRSIALLLSGLLACACSTDLDQDGSDDPEGPDAGGEDQPPDDEEDPVEYLMPLVAHTGFDGDSTFQVPVYTSLEDATFELEDESIADIEPVELPPDLEEVLGSFGRSWAMITTQQPGTTAFFATAFFATAGDVRLDASLMVAEYDPEVVAVGAQRYNEPVDGDQPGRNACQTCHGGPEGVDHTPLATAYFEDQELLQIITTATYPGGDPVNDGNHTWNLTEPESAGIVPYLRSLQPRGFE
jgi:hypothetical protein